MSEASKSEHAQLVYNDLCNFLDNKISGYDKSDTDKVILFGIKGEDVPIQICMMVDEDHQVVELLSQLPFSMPEEKRIDGAIAACAYSFRLKDGDFDYDMSNGNIRFRLSQSCLNRRIGNDLFNYMISLAETVVEEYNDKFFMLSKNMLTIDDLLNQQ